MLRLVVGGCWYGSKVDARLAQSLVQFAVHAPAHGCVMADLTFEDGMLDLGRNRLLANAIGTGADWLVSIDSDCSFVGQTEAICTALRRWNSSEVAIVGAPVKQGQGDWNVLGHDELRLKEKPTEDVTVGSIGFGFVAFRCGWYVKHWPRAHREFFVPFFQTVVLPDPSARFGMGAWGEDFGHCKAVRDKGGKVVCAPGIRVPHHVVRVGHPAAKDE